MNIAITGASGFIGKALVKLLREKGHSCDPLTRKDIKGYTTVDNYYETPSSEVIIHLAQEKNRNIVNKQHPSYLNDEINLVRKLSEERSKKIIYISSSLVYNDQETSIKKTNAKLQANDLYSLLKIESEKIILANGGNVLRLSNVYGIGMSKKNVLSKIISQINDKEEINLIEGNAVRDYIFIDDVINAVSQIISSDLRQSKLNIGTGIGYSIKDIINKIQSVYKTNLPVSFERYDTNTSHIVLDITETKKMLKWEPATKFKDGIYSIMKSNIHT